MLALYTRRCALPPVLIAGAPRAGSTALWSYLLQSPNVSSPWAQGSPVKEVNFLNSNAWSNGVAWYASLLSSQNTTLLDGSCTSFLCPLAARRARRIFGKSLRVLFAVRNQVDRVHSHFQMCRRNARVQRQAFPHSFLSLVEQELAHIAWCDSILAHYTTKQRFFHCYVNRTDTCEFDSILLRRRGRTPGCRHLLAGSMYAAGSAPWVRVFGARNVLHVHQEELARLPQEVMARVATWLDLPPFLVRALPRPSQLRRRRTSRVEETLLEFFNRVSGV